MVVDEVRRSKEGLCVFEDHKMVDTRSKMSCIMDEWVTRLHAGCCRTSVLLALQKFIKQCICYHSEYNKSIYKYPRHCMCTYAHVTINVPVI